MTQNGTSSSQVREEVLKLITQKEHLENEIKELQATLAKNGVGMNDPLVDDEGFPFSNIDIYSVRHARHLLTCKLNDHKKLMKQIESGIAHYYSQGHESKRNGHDTATRKEEKSEPFARVQVVQPGSPADDAGLKDGDLVVEFGSVNKSNFRNMHDIGNVVSHSIGNKIRVKVKRENQILRINLTPRRWNGQGMLGCNVIPC